MELVSDLEEYSQKQKLITGAGTNSWNCKPPRKRTAWLAEQLTEVEENNILTLAEFRTNEAKSKTEAEWLLPIHLDPQPFYSSRSDRDAEILARLFTLQGAIWRKRNKKEEERTPTRKTRSLAIAARWRSFPSCTAPKPTQIWIGAGSRSNKNLTAEQVDRPLL